MDSSPQGFGMTDVLFGDAYAKEDYIRTVGEARLLVARSGY